MHKINKDLAKLARPLEWFKPDPKNARKHNTRNIDAIAHSLNTYGQQKPIVALDDGTVIAGNGTLESAKKLGWTKLACVTFSDADKAVEFAIADNRTAELAEWDVDILGGLLRELQSDGVDTSDLGFDDDELRKVLVKEHERIIGGGEDEKPPEERVAKRDNIARGKRIFDVTCGDSLVVLDSMPENSVDAVVCDPPYELGFMGRKWDASGIAFSVELWKKVLRVLKPGGHLLACGGTRTYHRMTCAIEDAGFEIRDCMAWLYGTGFPKSHDVSRAIDDAAGATRPVIATETRSNEPSGLVLVGRERQTIDREITAPVTDAAKQWDGWGTALKPAHEPIVMARKPLSEDTIAANVLKWGTGALNIRGARLGDGKWPSNVMFDQQAANALDAQSGIVAMEDDVPGGASRFFYVAKPSRAERDAGLMSMPEVAVGVAAGPAGFKQDALGRNIHPTVKPADLMHHLCVMVCPPGGLVVDPFCGSGSTGIGAVLGNFRFTGIELDPVHTEIALKRIRWWASQYE